MEYSLSGPRFPPMGSVHPKSVTVTATASSRPAAAGRRPTRQLLAAARPESSLPSSSSAVTHGILSHREVQSAYRVDGHQRAVRCSQVRETHAWPWCVLWQWDHRLSVSLEPVCALASHTICTGPAEVDILRVHRTPIKLRCTEHKRPLVSPVRLVWHGPSSASAGE